MSSCLSISFALLNCSITQIQNLYGIVVEKLQFSFIYQTCFDCTSAFISVIKPEITVELRTFEPKSSYGEIFFISPLELVDKVLTPKMKKKIGVTDFVSEKIAVEKCLNFDKSVIITRCSLLC